MEKKVLLILDASNPVNRLIRRAVVICVLTLISVFVSDSLHLVPVVYVPVLTAVLALIDKMLSEYRDFKRGE